MDACAFAAARIVGRATRRRGDARAGRLVLDGGVAGGATSFASPLQQLLEPSFCVVGCGAAAAGSVLGTLIRLGTETETSTGAVDTETATVPTWTLTETPGMLTLT